jgi:hypothetical protein
MVLSRELPFMSDGRLCASGWNDELGINPPKNLRHAEEAENDVSHESLAAAL